MGRFGVGAKLAGISVARKIELWSRRSPKEPWLYTYIDLDEIGSLNDFDAVEKLADAITVAVCGLSLQALSVQQTQSVV